MFNVFKQSFICKMHNLDPSASTSPKLHCFETTYTIKQRYTIFSRLALLYVLNSNFLVKSFAFCCTLMLSNMTDIIRSISGTK